MMSGKFLFLLLFVSLSLHSFAGVKFAKEPDWITPVSVSYTKSIPKSEISEGYFYMLKDRQENMITKQRFCHFAYKLVSENGVQNNSEIEISYVPAFQKLTINSLSVYRNGKKIDYKSRCRIKELQREESLEYHIYDETLTCYIILEDIRVGDIVEYSYTKEGYNPIFGNFYYAAFSYQMSNTLLDFYFKLIKPRDKDITIKYHDSDFKPVATQTQFGDELVWQKSNIPALKTEENTPHWFEAGALIELSSSNNWQDIRDWGVKVFKVNEPLSDSLKFICQKIKNNYSAEEDRIIATLRFVQKNIRYLGIEIGASSHKPASPNNVFKQRYGDCKDKALLLSKMLNEMGIEAYPAFVSTTYCSKVADYLPSPEQFDHAVVRVTMKNKKNYWFDATLTNQAGNLEHSFFARYGCALVLNGNTPKLDTIINQSDSYVKIEESYHVKDLNGNAELKVKTTYNGSEADDMRYSIAENSKKDLQDTYLNFYKNNFVHVDTLGSLKIEDDSINNEITVYENYKINDFWKFDDTIQKKKLSCYLSAYQINSKLGNYSKKYSNRQMPLALEFPLHLSQIITISLPREWSITKLTKHVDDEFFTFDYRTTYEDQKITLAYDIKTKQDFIPAGKASKFIFDIEQVRENLAYELFYDKSALTGVTGNGLIVIFPFLIMGLVGIGINQYVQKKRKERFFQNLG